MAIANQLEMQITAARIAPREREWDVVAAERDDLDRLANGTRGLLCRIVVGEDGKAPEHRELCDAVLRRDVLVGELRALEHEIGQPGRP